MSEQPEELIRAALKDGCRAHCDSLIHELRRLHALNGELLEALKLAQSIIGHPDDAHSKLIAAAIRARGNT
jgi:hypothetical protein